MSVTAIRYRILNYDPEGRPSRNLVTEDREKAKEYWRRGFVIQTRMYFPLRHGFGYYERAPWKTHPKREIKGEER